RLTPAVPALAVDLPQDVVELEGVEIDEMAQQELELPAHGIGRTGTAGGARLAPVLLATPAVLVPDDEQRPDPPVALDHGVTGPRGRARGPERQRRRRRVGQHVGGAASLMLGVIMGQRAPEQFGGAPAPVATP